MLTLTALVLSALHPATPVATTALAQKIQIIKGKKGSGTLKASNLEAGSVKNDAAGNAAKEQALERKSADLEAKRKALEQREQALEEKQAAAQESEKKQAEQKAKQREAIEKIGAQNQQLLRGAADGLAGD